jgi:hypothetical protein
MRCALWAAALLSRATVEMTPSSSLEPGWCWPSSVVCKQDVPRRRLQFGNELVLAVEPQSAMEGHAFPSCR